MAFIYNLTDSWNDVTTTWNGIKLAVTNTSSDASSKLLNLTVSGATTASFVVDKSGNLELNGSVNKVTITAPATAATFTLADGSTFATVGAHSVTFTATGTTALTLPTSGTVTALGNTSTGSGSIVLATSPTLVTPNLGTPSAATLTNATGLPLTTGISGFGTGVAAALGVSIGSAGAPVLFNGALGTPSSGTLTNCTGYSISNVSGLGSGVATWLTTPSSSNLRAAVTDETGTGSLVFATSPTLVTPDLGTPSAATLTNATGLPLTTGVTGTLPVANGGTGITAFGTGVATALGKNVTGSGGIVLQTSPSLVTPDLGTPSAATLTNATGLPISTGISGLGTGVATFLATPSSANLASAVTDETGTGPLVFATSPTFTSAVTLGTQSTTQGSLVLANTAAGSKSVTLKSSNSTAAAYSLTFPAAAPVNGYYLQTDTNGVLSWAAGGGGGGGSPGGSNTQIQFNNAGAFGGDAAFTFTNGGSTATMTLGVASTTSGVAKLYNSASANAITIASGNNSAAWTMTLPTSAGTNKYFLQTDGSGNTTWAAAAAGTINTGTIGQITYYSGTDTLSGTTTGTGVLTALGINVGTSGAFVAQDGALGTPSSGTLTNATGLPISTGVSGLGTGVATALAVNTGSSGAVVVNGGALGTPSSGTLTNATGLPISTGVSGLGTGVATALGVNVGTAGAVVVNGGALGTPSSGTLTNATGLPISTGVSGLGANVATFLGTPSSANLAAAVTDETGTGSLVFANTPTLVTPVLGTPTSGTLTNCTGLPISTGVSGLGSNVATFLATPSSANLASAVTDETGSGSLVFATSPTLTTPRVAGSSTGYTTVASANSSATNYTATLPAADFTVGYINLPQNSQTGAYVAVASDVGKHISITTGGVTVNASVFSAGDAFTIYNNSSSNQTITAGTNVTFRLAGTATTGNRTLAQYGVITLLCVTGGANPVFVVSGGGVT